MWNQQFWRKIPDSKTRTNAPLSSVLLQNLCISDVIHISLLSRHHSVHHGRGHERGREADIVLYGSVQATMPLTRTQNWLLADCDELFADSDKECIGTELLTAPLSQVKHSWVKELYVPSSVHTTLCLGTFIAFIKGVAKQLLEKVERDNIFSQI